LRSFYLLIVMTTGSRMTFRHFYPEAIIHVIGTYFTQSVFTTLVSICFFRVTGILDKAKVWYRKDQDIPR
jgi:hypothetical protein